MKVFAVEPTGMPLGNIGGGSLGPFGNLGNTISGGQSGGQKALELVTGAISSIIGIMTVAAGIWFIFQFIVGGFYWITSGGDKTKLETARDRINNAFVGLIVVVAGWSVLALAGQFFGYDIVIGNPLKVIQDLTP